MLRQTTVESGALQGVPCGDPRITVYRGVPYAKPPVGQLRWRAPQPVTPWEGVRQAAQFPPIGWQDQPGTDAADFWTRELNPAADACVISEDCLYLNIWTPARAADEKLPVYLWIHGGGLESGYAWEMEFDGERMARQGIIFITVGYRLNVFGLMCHREMQEDGCEGGANLCFLDMTAALRWIRRNAAAFGGDPERVTIGGQSGGALAVMGLLTAPMTRGLFSGAIAQSGGGLRAFGYGPTTATLREGQAKGADFLACLGCKTLDEARALPAEQVYRAFREFTRVHGRMSPIVDHVVFDEDINDAVLHDHHHPVPCLFGSTAGEGAGTPASPPAPADMEAFRRMVSSIFGDHAEAFLALCHAENMADVQALMRSGAFNPRTISVKTYAERQKAWARKSWFYLFDGAIPGEDHPGPFHGSDMWFTFDSLARCWRPFTGVHYDLALTMSGYWVNFVKHGNPNGCDMNGRALPCWHDYSAEEPFTMLFTDKAQRQPDDADALLTYRVQYHLAQCENGGAPIANPFG